MSDLTTIRAGHTEVADGQCGLCDVPWPCDTGVVLAALAESGSGRSSTMPSSDIRDVDDLRGMLPDEILAVIRAAEARAEAAERESQRLLTLNAAVAGENARLRAELARTLAAQRMAEENSRSHFVADGEGVSICRICDQPDDHTRTVIDHTPDCPFAALAATHENPGVQHAADSEEVAPESGSDGSMSSGQLDTSDSEPWCTVDSHIVLPSGEACICGENRMELML